MGKFDTHGGHFAPDGYLKVEEGGSHEENPNGGVQLGVDGQGVPNMLEENEPVYDDFVYSDNVVADKEMLKKYKLHEKYAGKKYSEIADLYVDEAENRPNDPISNNGLNTMLVRLANAQEEQKQLAEQKEMEDELANLSPEELAELESMLSQAEGEQIQQPIAPEQVMMEQSAPGVMPYACGGRVNKFTGGGDTSLGEVMKVDENGNLIDDIEPAVVTAESGVVGPVTSPRIIIPVSSTQQVTTPSIYEKNLERKREASSDLTDLLLAQALMSGKDNNSYLPLLLSTRYRHDKAAGGPVNKFVKGGPWEDYDPGSMTPEEYARIHGLTLSDFGGVNSMTPEEIKRITGRSIIKEVPESLFDVDLTPFNPEDYYDYNPSRIDAIEADTPLNNSVVGAQPSISAPPVESVTPVDNKKKVLPTWQRYAAPVMSGLLGLYDMFQPADEYNIPRYSPVLPYGRLNLVDPTYNPVDENILVNNILAQSAGTARSIRNAGLGPSVGATLLSADFNTGRNIGAARLQAKEANDQQRNAVIAGINQNRSALGQFNYGMSKDRTGILNDAMTRNIQNDLLRQRLNYQAEGEKYAAIGNQLNLVGQALSGIGKQNFSTNMVNGANPNYQIGPDGEVYFVSRLGGPLLKKIK